MSYSLSLFLSLYPLSWHLHLRLCDRQGLCPWNHTDSSKKGAAFEAPLDVGLSGHEFLGASATLVPTPGLPTSYSPSAERGPLGVPSREATLEGGLDPGRRRHQAFSRAGEVPALSTVRRGVRAASRARPPRGGGRWDGGPYPQKQARGCPRGSSASKESQAVPLLGQGHLESVPQGGATIRNLKYRFCRRLVKDRSALCSS